MFLSRHLLTMQHPRRRSINTMTVPAVAIAMNELSKPSRRRFLLNTSMFAAALELSGAGAALAQELAPALACHDGDEPTVRQSEGPFFKPRSPERSDLREPGTG